MRQTQRQWFIIIHWDATHQTRPLGPYGQTEAEQAMTAARKRYRAAGETPPKMERILVGTPDQFVQWTTKYDDDEM